MNPYDFTTTEEPKIAFNISFFGLLVSNFILRLSYLTIGWVGCYLYIRHNIDSGYLMMISGLGLLIIDLIIGIALGFIPPKEDQLICRLRVWSEALKSVHPESEFAKDIDTAIGRLKHG